MRLLAVALSTVVGCGGGGSGDKDSGMGNDGGPGILAVTVNATGLSPAMRTAIQSLLLRVEGDTTDTTIIVPPGAFDDESHTENFTPTGHTGPIRLQVTARNDTGGVISIAASSVTVVPGVTTPVTVTLTESSPVALLVVEPSPVDFGNIVLGAPVGRVMVTVRNSGGTASGPLTSVINGDTAVFVIDPATTCDGKTLAPAESCMFAMEFRPTQEGARSASLAMTASPGGTATVSLTGTGATPAVLVVSPEIENLGDVETGTFGPSHTITFMNTGGSPTGTLMSTIGGTDAAEIKIATDGCSNQPLNAGSTCTLTLQLRPTTRGAKSGMLTMVGAPGGTTVTTLTGRGLTPSALEVNPTMQDFGTAVTNTMSEATFTVRNGGEVTTGALMITLGGVNFDEFSLPNDSCSTTTLAFGATCSVTVRFRPTTIGPKSATLRIRGTPGGDITAALSGTAAGPGALAIAPASIDFGGIVVGQSSTTRVFTVTNTGGAATGALSVSLGGTSASQFVVQADTCNGQILGPSGMCTVGYQLSPNSAGGKTASLIVASNPGGTATASLVGSGLAAAVLSANATTAALGTVDVGAIGASFTWTVTNVGGVPTGTLATSSTGDAVDMLISGNCTQVLAVGASCTISVTLAPQTGGNKSTTITVTGSPGGSVSLVATGTARPQQVLTVTKAGSGTGTISSSPVGINCPADCTEGYRYNTTVTLTATPTGGATFTGWMGACTGTGACIISMVIDQNVTATFAAPRYQLTVSTSGVSTGTVTSTNVAGITCGADCSELYDSGTMVTLMAQEAAGYSFGGWAGGGCSGLLATCTVTMNMARTVTATFTQNSYAMAITVSGMGRVTSNPIGIDCTATAGDCGEPYLSGTTVTLTAAPTAGYSFMGWTVGAGNCTGTTTPCTVGMTGPRNLTATFEPIPVVLTVVKNGNGTGTVTSDSGGITCGTGSACMGTYTSGTPVILTAAPDTGMRVSAWSGGGCTGTGLTCTVTLATSTTVTVTFTKLTYTIMSSKIGAGAGVTGALIDADIGALNCGSTCNATYNYGDVVVLTATPGTQSSNGRTGFFLGWGGTLSGGAGCTGTGTCTLTVTDNGTITARLETAERVTVTISTMGMATGSVVSTPAGIDTCDQTTTGMAACTALFPANTSVTLTASAMWDSWSGGGGNPCTSTVNPCVIALGTSDESTTANFK